MWFRRDLRLRDNPALTAALAEGDVLPLFVVDPVFESAGAPRRALLHDCLERLREATEGALVIRYGDPVEEVPTLAAEIGADTVYVAKDFAPYGRRRDETVADALRSADRRLRGVGSPYAIEPGTIEKQAGGAYTVFTPFSRRWRDHDPGEPIDAPRSPNWVEFPIGDLPARPGIEIDLPAASERAVMSALAPFATMGSMRTPTGAICPRSGDESPVAVPQVRRRPSPSTDRRPRSPQPRPLDVRDGTRLA